MTAHVVRLQVKVLIRHIEVRQLLPPAVVLQALAPNRHLQLGVVKVCRGEKHIESATWFAFCPQSM